MPTPRHIYSSTASRRERSWGRRRRGVLLGRALGFGLMGAGAAMAGSLIAQLAL